MAQPRNLRIGPCYERDHCRPGIRLEAGDPAPWFHQRSPTNPNYAFGTAAGRYIVLCFFGSAAHPLGRAALEAVVANRRYFDDHNISFFGVSLDVADETEGRVRDSLRPGAPARIRPFPGKEWSWA